MRHFDYKAVVMVLSFTLCVVDQQSAQKKNAQFTYVIHFLRHKMANTESVIRNMLKVIFNFLLVPAAYRALPVQYAGCMIQTDLVGFQVTDEEVVPDSVIGQRGSFRHLSGDVSQMTVQLCVLRCWNQRFTFAGIQDSKRCYCANTIIRMTKVLDENCNKRCLGNCKQRCGGLLALSTYETGYEKEPDQLVDNVRFNHYGFKGCYEFNEAAMCFDGNDHSKAYLPEMVSGRMKPQFCVAYCLSKGLKYAILKSTSSCCCGWTFPDQLQPMTSRDPCNVPCVGAPEPFCVGQEGVTHYVTVYFTQDLETKAKFPRMNTVTLLTNGWILPQFSDNVNFENEGPSPDVIKYLRSRSADKKKGNRQIVDPVNTDVAVVDVPEKKGRGAATTIALVLGVLVAIAVVGFFTKRLIAAAADLDLSQYRRTELKFPDEATSTENSAQREEFWKQKCEEWKVTPSSTIEEFNE